MLAKYPYCMASAPVWYTIIQDVERGQGAVTEGRSVFRMVKAAEVAWSTLSAQKRLVFECDHAGFHHPPATSGDSYRLRRHSPFVLLGHPTAGQPRNYDARRERYAASRCRP